VCYYDLSTEFGKLEKGKYTVVLMLDGSEYFRFGINYTLTLDGAVKIKHFAQ
jgi:hypothetical protein